MGKQQATSFPAPLRFLQKYQITAGILTLAQISLRGKADHFPKLHSTIFCLFVLSVFFFPIFQLDMFCVLIQHLEPVFSLVFTVLRTFWKLHLSLFVPWDTVLEISLIFLPLVHPGRRCQDNLTKIPLYSCYISLKILSDFPTVLPYHLA